MDKELKNLKKIAKKIVEKKIWKKIKSIKRSRRNKLML